MSNALSKSIKATAVFAVACCVIYPLSVTLFGKILFSDNANGGIISIDGKPLGAKLIGQSFSTPKYFQSRPSAAGEKGYDAASSSGSNLGPTNKKLADRIKGDVETFLKNNPSAARGSVPPDIVTTSASGLDPHISPEAALLQVARVAGARGLPESQVKSLVEKYTKGPELRLLGESRVNVLLLNLALDGHEDL